MNKTDRKGVKLRRTDYRLSIFFLIYSFYGVKFTFHFFFQYLIYCFQLFSCFERVLIGFFNSATLNYIKLPHYTYTILQNVTENSVKSGGSGEMWHFPLTWKKGITGFLDTEEKKVHLRSQF